MDYQFQRIAWVCLWLVASTLCASCSRDLAEVRTSSGKPCESTRDGELYFHGSNECFEALPQKRMSGFWLSGNELTMFFHELPPDRPHIGEYFTGLALSDEAYTTAESKIRGGQLQLFKIEFIGADPAMPGSYGGGANRGVYVSKLTSITEIVLPRGWGAH